MLGAPYDLSVHPYDDLPEEDIMLLDCSHSHSSSSFEDLTKCQPADEFDVSYPSAFESSESSHHSGAHVVLEGDDLDSQFRRAEARARARPKAERRESEVAPAKGAKRG